MIRVRTSAESFQRSDLVVATSTQNGSFSPSTTARNYVTYFKQPANESRFRLDFDVLNVDPLDTANTVLSLENVVIEHLGVGAATNQQSVASFNFRETGANGFVAEPEIPVIQKPAVFDSTNGLLIRGIEPDPVRGATVIYPPVIFGYWGLTTAVPFEGNKLYRVRWTVNSDATAENFQALPTFRLRVNDSSLKFAALTNIDSVNTGAEVPRGGNAVSYDLWMLAPAEIAGNTWIFSFDYLYVDKSTVPGNVDNDDPTLAVILESLAIDSFDLPAAP